MGPCGTGSRGDSVCPLRTGSEAPAEPGATSPARAARDGSASSGKSVPASLQGRTSPHMPALCLCPFPPPPPRLDPAGMTQCVRHPGSSSTRSSGHMCLAVVPNGGARAAVPAPRASAQMLRLATQLPAKCPLPELVPSLTLLCMSYEVPFPEPSSHLDPREATA